VLGVLALAYSGVCVACFLLVESCGDSQFAWYRYLVLVGGAIALAIALIAGFGKEDRSSWIWVPIVVASPFVGPRHRLLRRTPRRVHRPVRTLLSLALG